MKVKVTRANKDNPDYWYNSHIGKIFEFLNESTFSYQVNPEYFTPEPGLVEYHIHKDDCEIISEFKVDGRVRFPTYNNPSKDYNYGTIIDVGIKWCTILPDDWGCSAMAIPKTHLELLKETKYLLVPEGIIIDDKIRIDKLNDMRDIFFFYDKTLKMWDKTIDYNLEREKYYTGFHFKIYELIKTELKDLNTGNIYYYDDPEDQDELKNYENYGIFINGRIYYYEDNEVRYFVYGKEIDELYEVREKI